MKICAGSLIGERAAHQPSGGGSNPTPALQKSPHVCRIPLAQANELLRFHYLGPVRTATVCFGHAEGATVWGVLRSRLWDIRLREAGFKTLELIRMVGMPKHGWATSSLLSYSVREIFKLGISDCLVTYADRMQGHSGKVYLAANWKPCEEDGQPDGYVWRLDGEIVSRKRFFGEFGTQKISVVRAHYGDRLTLERDVPKLRFFRLHDPSLESQFHLATKKRKTWGKSRLAEFLDRP